MQITVRKINNPEGWDKELIKLDGSVFMSVAWLNAVSSVDRVPVYFNFFLSDRVVGMIGGLEMMTGKGPEKQLFFYSGITSGLVEEEFLKGCKKALLGYAIKNSYFRVIIKSYDYTNYIPAGLDQFREFSRMEYFIDLKKDDGRIIKGFDPEIRRRARKAAREGVSCKITYSKEMLDKLFELLVSTKKIRESKGYGSYRYLNLPFSDRNVLEGLLEKKFARMFYAEDSKGILGVQLMLDFPKRAYGLLMGVSQDGYRKSVPSFLLYEGTLSLKREGYTCYNFGAIPVGKGNEGLKKYKDSLGAKIIVSKEESTDFLAPPLSYMNPLMGFKRVLFETGIPWRLKKLLLNAADIVLNGRDHY